MNKLFSLFAIATLYCATNIALAKDHHSDKKVFKVTELKPGFQFLQGKGGNILLSAGKDGLLIVDSDYSVNDTSIRGNVSPV